MSDLKAQEYKKFEDIKAVRLDGSEYWMARDLAPILDYMRWENFTKVIDKAMIACKNSGHAVEGDFREVTKIVKAGATSKRLVIRGDIRQWNQMLAEAARNAGVITNEEFAVFQNAGYVGLYGGLTVDGVHKKKGLAVRDKILDFMGSTELVANLFRISQTEDKLKRDAVCDSDTAAAVHHAVGKEVRAAIERVGGTMPEDLPTPKKSIAQIEKEQLAALKRKSKRLMLDE